MHVDFSFCLNYHKKLDFSKTEQFLSLEHKLLPVLLTWLHLVYGKNIALHKTPTFDGVCRKLFYIIFVNFEFCFELSNMC